MKNEVRKNTEMNKPELNIVINDSRWEDKLSAIDDLCRHVFTTTFAFMAKEEPSELFTAKATLVVNLSLSNDEEVHRLNKEFRNMDKPTNVLSFANVDDPDFDEELANADDFLELGDIIIALETLEREAQGQSISLQDHLSHLLVHGLLHLLGYDHQEDEEAEHMEGLEIKILQHLNIKNPYEE